MSILNHSIKNMVEQKEPKPTDHIEDENTIEFIFPETSLEQTELDPTDHIEDENTIEFIFPETSLEQAELDPTDHIEDENTIEFIFLETSLEQAELDPTDLPNDEKVTVFGSGLSLLEQSELESFYSSLNEDITEFKPVNSILEQAELNTLNSLENGRSLYYKEKPTSKKLLSMQIMNDQVLNPMNPVPIVPRNNIKPMHTQPIIKVTHPDDIHSSVKKPKEPQKTSYYQMKNELLENLTIVKMNNILYYRDDFLNHYIPIKNLNFDQVIRQKIPKKYLHSINGFACKEIYNWLISDSNLTITEEELKPKRKYVAFKNCIVKTTSNSIENHRKDLFFTSVINADFPIDYTPTGLHFENFISQVTNGNNQFYSRIQELIGYVISEYRELKIIPYFIGPKDCGKSVVLKILEELIGEQNVSNLSLSDFNSAVFLAELHEKKLNTCGETSEISLNKLDTIKKLTGGDYVMGNPKHAQPIKFKNKAVLVFAGNHLPVLKETDHSNAFRERLLLFPFNYVVPKNEQDPLLFEKLKKEMDYIAKWALEGLQRLQSNNFRFTSYNVIDEILSEYFIQENTSIADFIKTHCEINPSLKEYSENLILAYKNYCLGKSKVPLSSHAFHKYCKEQLKLEQSKFREGTLNKRGYLGIGLISNHT